MDSSALPKLRQPTSLQDTVYNAVREAILTGRLAPGQRLQQVQLAENLGVSRMPVREALRRLEVQGLVVFRQNYGAHVKLFSHKDIEEIYFIRFLLEGAAAGLAAAKVNDTLIQLLERTLNEMEQGLKDDDNPRVQDANRTFHQLIYQATGSETLITHINQLWNGFPRHPLQLKQRVEVSVAEHGKVLEALRRREPQQAEQAMREHLKSGLVVLLANLEG